MNIGIIGCGLIGQKRSNALPTGHNIKVFCDSDISKAQKLSQKYKDTIVSSNWEEVVTNPDINIVIIATTHNSLAQITHAAVENKKHVLVEKPAARNYKELEPTLDLLEHNDVTVKVGFNHRFHPSFIMANEIIKSNALGELYFIRANYGHGGRIGYNKEWRAKREISGGGELLDQGSHLIDLSRWFLGDFTQTQGYIPTYYWDMQVEDNAFICLETKSKQIAWLHATWTEWKNTFNFEITGKNGKLHINGLGGSYGTEKLTYFKMLPEMGPPETTTWEYPFKDNSWELEYLNFIDAIEKNIQPLGNLEDAYENLKIINNIYSQRS